MKEEIKVLELDKYELGILINALNEFRNKMIKEGKDTEYVDEVRLLDNKYAILFIRGERPVMDFKYDILKHPNVAFTTDGKEKPYLHGGTENAIASISIDENVDNYDFTEIEDIANDYELITSEEVEDYFKGKGE